jgi:agmatine deiminase
MSAERPIDTKGTPSELGFRMPAEWEPHAATWLAWPHHRTDWLGKPELIPWVFAELARHLAEVERVRILVRDRAELSSAARVLGRAGVRMTEIDFLISPTNRSWTRDSLPTFVVRDVAPTRVRRQSGPSRGRAPTPARELGAVKWRFNGWARYADHKQDEASGLKVARAMTPHVWQPRSASRRVVLEGGGIDVDGEGTLLADLGCLLSGPHARNPESSAAELERVFAENLGVTRTIWFDGGVTGDDTSGHVDDFCRFVSPGTVVLCAEKNRRDPNARALDRARARVRGARDARGRRLEVVALPMPAPVTYAGLRLPASYANFYIANEVVLVPTFNDPADRAALGLLGELFPKRRVVGVHMRDFVLGQGTIHCTTQQEPVGRGLPPRFVKPLTGSGRLGKPPPGFD